MSNAKKKQFLKKCFHEDLLDETQSFSDSLLCNVKAHKEEKGSPEATIIILKDNLMNYIERVNILMLGYQKEKEDVDQKKESHKRFQSENSFF